jgi:hypothetical protein
LRLVPVLGCEPNVDMLPGAMTSPPRQIEHETPRARRLADGLGNPPELPRQSP